ncbi:Hypothetical predicted protein, partial [Paramuricea clavata]
MSKKKRVAVSFDLESVKHRMREEDVYADGIRKHLDALRNVDIKRVASTLKEAEILQVLVCKLGVETLETLRKAAQHVPRNICRVVNEKSLRIDYIHKIFTLVSTNVNMAIQDVEFYVNIMESYCPSLFLTQDVDDKLLELTKSENMSFIKFLTPPVSACLRCGKSLTMRNYPAKVKLFSVNGPIPCSKITLECRDCSCAYGVCNFSNKEGTHLYPIDTKVNIVE